jgi:hypothetical protein
MADLRARPRQAWRCSIESLARGQRRLSRPPNRPDSAGCSPIRIVARLPRRYSPRNHEFRLSAAGRLVGDFFCGRRKRGQQL